MSQPAMVGQCSESCLWTPERAPLDDEPHTMRAMCGYAKFGLDGLHYSYADKLDGPGRCPAITEALFLDYLARVGRGELTFRDFAHELCGLVARAA